MKEEAQDRIGHTYHEDRRIVQRQDQLEFGFEGLVREKGSSLEQDLGCEMVSYAFGTQGCDMIRIYDKRQLG